VIQDIHDISAIQRYPIGMKLTVDERTFAYCKAFAALVHPCTYRLAVSADQILAVNDLLSVGSAAVGSKTITVAVATFQGGVVVANELVGGFIEVWPVAGGGFMWRRIKANTAVSGGNITITVDKAFNLVAGASSQVSIHPSVYRAVRMAGTLAGYESAVCLPTVPVTSGSYFWGLVRGKAFVAPTGVWPGGASAFRDAYFHSDGCINSFSNEIGAVAGNASPQRVGFALGAGNYGTAEIMLQLD
jgi:hypothetical protein